MTVQRMQRRLERLEQQQGGAWLPWLHLHPSAWPAQVLNAVADGSAATALRGLPDARVEGLLSEVRHLITQAEEALT